MVSFLVFKKSIKGGNVYIENIGSDIPTLNPHNCSDISSNRVMLDIYEGLVDYDQDLNIVSTGCKSYEIQNENKTFIFHLRENAKWSNGDAITADDYVYSYRRAVDPNTLAQVYIEQMYDIVNAKEIINGNINKEELGVYADDKYTLRIELENPNSEFIYYLTLPIFLPVYRPNIEKYGISTFAKVDNIVCNGPYMMKSFIHNSHVIL
jgi:oligopeptide transport system substrate-binding protein